LSVLIPDPNANLEAERVAHVGSRSAGLRGIRRGRAVLTDRHVRLTRMPGTGMPSSRKSPPPSSSSRSSAVRSPGPAGRERISRRGRGKTGTSRRAPATRPRSRSR
jgi:hypothetical protein